MGNLTQKSQKGIIKQDAESGRANDMGDIERHGMETVVPQPWKNIVHCVGSRFDRTDDGAIKPALLAHTNMEAERMRQH